MSECICCNENNWYVAHKLPKFLFGCVSEILVCKECGAGKTMPKPDVSLDFYEDNKKYNDLFVENEDLYKSFACSLLSLLGKEGSHDKRLLDIGCGGGFLVQVANEQGFQATGIDANGEMVQWAKKRGIPIEQGDIQEKIVNKEQYDVLVLSAVLEHLSDPLKLLNDCKKILSPNGRILISQASFDGLLPRLFPWGWYGWQPKEHYWHFTPKSFDRLTSSVSMKMIFCKRNSLYHRYYFSGGLKNIIGRNMATFIARCGDKVGLGDNFDCIITNETMIKNDNEKND